MGVTGRLALLGIAEKKAWTGSTGRTARQEHLGRKVSAGLSVLRVNEVQQAQTARMALLAHRANAESVAQTGRMAHKGHMVRQER
jgi:hypothetical protein